MKVLLVIPCYNEENNIIYVIEAIEQKLPDVDYIVVNDGSTDSTSNILKIKNINHISLPVNCGLKAAFQSGIKWALQQSVHYDAICQFDADGQHIPEYIIEMKELMQESTVDVVIGSRYKKSSKNLSLGGERVEKKAARIVLIGLIYLLTRKKITDPTSGLRMYRDTVYPLFAEDDNLGPEPDAIVYFLKQHYHIVELPVIMNERVFGESYLTVSQSVRYMFNMINSILLIQWWRK